MAHVNVTRALRQLASTLTVQGKLGEAENITHEALSQVLTYSSFGSSAGFVGTLAYF
jgi:hypothetical protein